MSSSIPPRHRTILVVDVEGSTTRTNPGRAMLRNTMYELLEEAFLGFGISDQHRDLVDRGDGAVVLVHPVDQIPSTLLLGGLIPALADLLRTHNDYRPEHRFRLRVSLHEGEVHYDSRGPYGEDLDLSCRLLDAPVVKKRLRQTVAPLILAVSQRIYFSIVRHGYDGIERSAYEPTDWLDFGGLRQRGWTTLPTPAPLPEQPWSFHPATGDRLIDALLHRAGQELDAQATVRSLDTAAIVDQIVGQGRAGLPGTA